MAVYSPQIMIFSSALTHIFSLGAGPAGSSHSLSAKVSRKYPYAFQQTAPYASKEFPTKSAQPLLHIPSALAFKLTSAVMLIKHPQ